MLSDCEHRRTGQTVPMSWDWTWRIFCFDCGVSVPMPTRNVWEFHQFAIIVGLLRRIEERERA